MHADECPIKLICILLHTPMHVVIIKYHTKKLECINYTLRYMSTVGGGQLPEVPVYKSALS